MSQHSVISHVSLDPERLLSISDDMRALRRRLLAGETVADAETIAKAAVADVKAIEVDLHARMFASQLDRGLRGGRRRTQIAAPDGAPALEPATP